MKKLILYLIVFLIALPSIISCKKGEEDPFFSFKTRTARLNGEWKLVSGSETISSEGNVCQTIFTGSTATSTCNLFNDSYQYVESMIFNKDKTFEINVIEDGDLTLIEGFWSFMNRFYEYANKECIILRISKENDGGEITTYSGDEMPVFVYRFLKLSSKEAIIEAEGERLETWSGDITTYTSTKTFEKQ